MNPPQSTAVTATYNVAPVMNTLTEGDLVMTSYCLPALILAVSASAKS
jgi:hypothetical protein